MRVRVRVLALVRVEGCACGARARVLAVRRQGGLGARQHIANVLVGGGCARVDLREEFDDEALVLGVLLAREP